MSRELPAYLKNKHLRAGGLVSKKLMDTNIKEHKSWCNIASAFSFLRFAKVILLCKLV